MDKLTSQTMLCPPEQFRYALGGWSADHVEAMNKGDATAGLLQKAMWKLLLAHIPRRCNTNRELNFRFRLALSQLSFSFSFNVGFSLALA